MAVARNLMVRAGADFSAITKQASKASNSMRGMQNSVSKSCKVMSSAAAGLKKAFGALGIVLSFTAIASAAKEAAASYDEQVEGEVKLARVMRNTMSASNDQIQSILDLASAQQELGIIADDVTIAGAQELATYLSLTDSLETLIPVMNDMAAQQYGYNVTAEQTTSIATMLGKVMEGQVGGLSRYGYYFDEAQEKILKFGTESERAAVLAQVVSQSVGGMNAALAATPTGRMRQLSNTLGDIKDQFGQAVRTISTVFLPVLNTVAKVLAAVATLANKVAQAIANVFGGTAAGKEWQYLPPATAVEGASDAMDDLADSTRDSGKAARDAHNDLQTLSFDTLNIMKAQNELNPSSSADASGYTPSSGGGSDLISEMDTAATQANESFGWLEQRLQNLKAIFQDFMAGINLEPLRAAWERLKESVGGLTETVSSYFQPVWENILKPFGQWTINELLPESLKTLDDLFDDIKLALDELNPAFELATEFIGAGGKLIGADIISMLQDLQFSLELLALIMTGDFAGAFTLVKEHAAQESAETRQKWADFPEWWETNVCEPINEYKDTWIANHPIIQGALDALQAKLDSVFGGDETDLDEWSKNANQDFDDFDTGLSDTETNTGKTVGEISGHVTDLETTVDDTFTGMGGKIDEARDKVDEDFSDMTKSVEENVGEMKKLLDFSWSVPRPKLPQITWFYNYVYSGDGTTVPIPQFNVNWYARGGIFDSASIIGVGEAGKEAVVPLEHNLGWISKIADELSGQMSGGAFGIDPAEFFQEMRSAVLQGMMSAMSAQGNGRQHVTELSVNGRAFARAIYSDMQAVAREQGISLIKS